MVCEHFSNNITEQTRAYPTPPLSLLGGVCSGPATEVTLKVRAPEVFPSGFACLSWLVATLVFGSLERFSVTASMTVFISWISAHFKQPTQVLWLRLFHT